MQMILFLAVIIGLGVGGWQVCENTDVCVPKDESKVSLEQVVAEVAGDEVAQNESAKSKDAENKDSDSSNSSKNNADKSGSDSSKDDESSKKDNSAQSKDSKTNTKTTNSTTKTASATKTTAKPATCTLYLTAQIRSGGNNDKAQVIKLEKFLNEFEGEKLVAGGKYDAADVAAVKRFQQKYSAQVLTPYKLTKPTGEVMSSTLAQINKLHCNGLSKS